MVFLLSALLVIDAMFVVAPDYAWTPPYCTMRSTLLGRVHSNYSSFFYQRSGVAVHDGTSAKWVWYEENPLDQWPDTWVPLSNLNVGPPQTQASGFLTPARITWYHQPGLVVPEELGGEATEARLRLELADRIAKDPVIGPRMPKWYWQKLATVDGVTVTWNYPLLLHDVLFIVALVALGWHTLASIRFGVQHLRRPGTGFCCKCRYDLRGLATDRCPECGEPIHTATP